MEENKSIKVSISTFCLIIAIIVICIMGYFIYKINNDKKMEMKKTTMLEAQVKSLNSTISELQGKIDIISNTINSNVESNTTTQEKNKKINVKEYEGKWNKDNAEITIKAINEDIINFEYIVVSAAPAERIATIQINNLKLDENGSGSFNFEGDGFAIDGNGNGTINLSEGNVTINIIKVNMGEDNRTGWTIGEGKRIFSSKTSTGM